MQHATLATPPAKRPPPLPPMGVSVVRREPLGTIAKYATAESISFRVGLVLQKHGKPVEDRAQRRLRYQRQEVAAAILRPFVKEVLDAEGNLVPERLKSGGEKTRFKVCVCGRISLKGDVARVHKTTHAATYKEMVTCSSVWTCAVCGSVVSIKRRNEAVQAVTQAEQQGYMVLLVTYTARHSSTTDLAWFYDAMSWAHRRLWSGGDIKAIKAQFGIIGMIGDREITFSRENGPHPHIHELVFVKRPQLSQDQVQAIREQVTRSVRRYRNPAARHRFYEERLQRALRRAQQKLDEPVVRAFDRMFRARWEAAAAQAGLDMDAHGFDVTSSTARVAEYIAKFGHEPRWREADELTKWHAKTARREDDSRREGYTPWQLLDLAAAGDEWAKQMFIQYAFVYFGKRQLHWSKGLKQRFGIQDKSDEELAQEENEEATLMLVIDAPMVEFRERVLARRARAQYLDLCELGDRDAIVAAIFEVFGFRPLVYEYAPGQDALAS